MSSPVSASPELLPNLIIIGAMKAGTSSLQYYLRQHPEVLMSAEKELNFFIEARNWNRGVAWYASQFGPGPVRGEASPNYSAARRFPGVPERMHSVVPDAKLIYLVRDPVERAISHWVHNYSAGAEDRPFEEAIRRWIYVERSLYWKQMEAFLAHFPREQILVLESEHLRTARAVTLRRVFEFLGVDPDFQSPRFRLERHRSSLLRRNNRAGRWFAGTAVAERMRRFPQPWRWQLRFLVYRPLSSPIQRPEMTGDLRAWFLDQVRADVGRLGEFMGRDLAGWLA